MFKNGRSVSGDIALRRNAAAHLPHKDAPERTPTHCIPRFGARKSCAPDAPSFGVRTMSGTVDLLAQNSHAGKPRE
jgi:hypothetical protein